MATKPSRRASKPGTKEGTRPGPKARAGTRSKLLPKAKPAARERTRRKKVRPASAVPPSVSPGTRAYLDHYHQLFHHAIEWVSLQTVDGVILDVNPAGARMLGYTPEEIIGRNVTEMMPPGMVERLSSVREDLVREKSKVLEAENLHSNGTIIPVEVALSLVEDSGEPLVVVHVRDITMRKDAERALHDSEALLRSVLENAPDIILALDRTGRVLFINHTATARSVSEFVGTDLRNFLPEDYREEVDRALEAGFVRGEPYDFEVRTLGPNGRSLWFAGRVSPVPDEAEVESVIVCARDITERKRMEESIRESEDKYRALAEGSVHGIAIVQGFPPRAVFANQALADLAGVTRDEFLSLSGEEVLALVHPDDRESFLRRFEDRLAGKELQGVTLFRALQGDGSVRWVEIRSKPITYLGKPALHASLMDVTARAEAQAALKESEEKYRALVEQSLQGVVVGQGDPPRVVYANPAMGRILGISPEQALSLSTEGLVSLTHPDDRYVFEQYSDRLAGKPVPERYELRIRHTDGTLRWLEGSSQRIVYRGEAAIQGTFVDISERKRAEEALRESEAHFRAIVQDQTEMICRFLPDTTLTFVNKVYARAFGRTPGELLGKPFLHLIPEKDQGQVLRQLASLSRERPVSTHEHRVLAADGSVRWQQWTNRALFDEDGNLTEYQSVGRDVTDRKVAEEALRQSEETARAILNATRDLAVLMDTDGRVIALNESLASGLGKSPEEVVGTVIYDYFRPDTVEARKRTVEAVIRSGQPGKHEDVTRGRVFSSRVFPLFGSDGRVEKLASFATDVTEQRRADSLRREAEKSQAIAILAGGIAQNFRDVLMSLTASATFLRQRVPETGAAFADLDRIENGCARMSSLVDQIYSIGQRLFPDSRRTDVNACMQQAIDDLSGRLDGERSPEAVLAPDLCTIQADPEYIQRVFFIILENSVEAVALGGEIRVRTENVPAVPSSVADRLGVSHGPFVHVHVADTGCGMTSDELSRVFDPFFTTKQTGRGMGMPVARAVIENYGGLTFVDSEKGRGTHVHVYMPAERPAGPDRSDT